MAEVSGDALEAAVRALRGGRPVVYPTETVYGLGADADNRSALVRMLRLKGRSAGTGVSLLVASLAAAAPYLAGDSPDSAMRLAERFWPGPLTIVLPAAPGLAVELCGPAGGVGLRCSPDPMAMRLVAEFGRALTSTSANPTGKPPACTVDEARAYFGDAVEAYLDGGCRDGAAASTVVEFQGGNAFLRRAGVVPAAAIREVVDLEDDAR